VPTATAAPSAPEQPQQASPSVTVVFDGDVYGWDDYIENKVVSGIRDALDRDVRLQ